MSNTDIGRAVERTQPWVTKWARSAKPPKDFEIHRPLAAFLGVEENWLIRGEGNAPDPELWDRWLSSRSTKAPTRAPAGVVKAAGGADAKRGAK